MDTDEENVKFATSRLFSVYFVTDRVPSLFNISCSSPETKVSERKILRLIIHMQTRFRISPSTVIVEILSHANLV